jgi:hypothetical protein
VKIVVQSKSYHFVCSCSYIVRKSCKKKLENCFLFRLSYFEPRFEQKKKLENTTTGYKKQTQINFNNKIIIIMGLYNVHTQNTFHIVSPFIICVAHCRKKSIWLPNFFLFVIFILFHLATTKIQIHPHNGIIT